MEEENNWRTTSQTNQEEQVLIILQEKETGEIFISIDFEMIFCITTNDVEFLCNWCLYGDWNEFCELS